MPELTMVTRYPNLLRRYLASAVDLLAVLFMLYLYTRSPLFDPASNVRTGVVVAVLVSYEPVMTALSCTLGQLAMRFRVRRADGRARISMGQAYGRAITKLALGIASFLTLPVRADRRAIHDLVAGTLVIEASEAG